MRLGLAIGAAVIATTMVAYAADSDTRRFVFHRGANVEADANGDGWLSRDEAGAQADRLFADLDRNSDGRITDSDHEQLRGEVEAEVERAMAEVDREMANLDLELEGLDEEIEARLQFLDESNCETTTETTNGERRVTTVCRAEDAGEAAADGERRVDRRVRVIRHGPGDHVMVAPVPPIPPVPAIPPVPPMVWLSGMDDDEADLNGDGALSREEFRAQQLRYFDARDANGDGRVRYERPPEPPQAPEPPQPPRHRR